MNDLNGIVTRRGFVLGQNVVTTHCPGRRTGLGTCASNGWKCKWCVQAMVKNPPTQPRTIVYCSYQKGDQK